MVSRHRRHESAERAGVERIRRPLPPHPASLQKIARDRSAYSQRQQKRNHPRSPVVDVEVEPTSTTPTVIRSVPAQREYEISSPRISRLIAAVST